MRATALLTRAYRTLRDPLSRGLYWLELHGEKLAENNQRVPPELAELVFEVQERWRSCAAVKLPNDAVNTSLRDRRGAKAGCGRVFEEMR